MIGATEEQEDIEELVGESFEDMGIDDEYDEYEYNDYEDDSE